MTVQSGLNSEQGRVMGCCEHGTELLRLLI
jgi:hypothetical protein